MHVCSLALWFLWIRKHEYCCLDNEHVGPVVFYSVLLIPSDHDDDDDRWCLIAFPRDFLHGQSNTLFFKVSNTPIPFTDLMHHSNCRLRGPQLPNIATPIDRDYCWCLLHSYGICESKNVVTSQVLMIPGGVTAPIPSELKSEQDWYWDDPTMHQENLEKT